MHQVLNQLKEASVAGHRLSIMFKLADKDRNGKLTQAEMIGMFADADTDSKLTLTGI